MLLYVFNVSKIEDCAGKYKMINMLSIYVIFPGHLPLPGHLLRKHPSECVLYSPSFSFALPVEVGSSPKEIPVTDSQRRNINILTKPSFYFTFISHFIAHTCFKPFKNYHFHCTYLWVIVRFQSILNTVPPRFLREV